MHEADTDGRRAKERALAGWRIMPSLAASDPTPNLNFTTKMEALKECTLNDVAAMMAIAGSDFVFLRQPS